MNTMSPRKQKAIVALLSNPTQVAASKQCGVPLRTLQTWLNDPGFFNALIAEFNQINTAKITYLMSIQTDAIRALEDVMNHPAQPGAANKRKAAQDILRFGERCHQFVIIESRIKRMEDLQK